MNKDWKMNIKEIYLCIIQIIFQVKSIEPIFNRCVIFNKQIKIHGHPEPLCV